MKQAHDSAEDIVTKLPDDESIIKHAEATLLFIGEAWINDYAREVDDGRTTFTVPLADLYIPLTNHIDTVGDATDTWAIHSTIHNHHVSDVFKSHDNAPEWVQTWTGPFTIKLVDWDTHHE